MPVRARLPNLSSRDIPELRTVMRVLENGRVFLRMERILEFMKRISIRLSRREETEIRRRGLLLIAIDKIVKTVGDISRTMDSYMQTTRRLPRMFVDMMLARSSAFLHGMTYGITSIARAQEKIAFMIGGVFNLLAPIAPYAIYFVYLTDSVAMIYKQVTAITESVRLFFGVLRRVYSVFGKPVIAFLRRILLAILSIETLQKIKLVRDLFSKGVGKIASAIGAGTGVAILSRISTTLAGIASSLGGLLLIITMIVTAGGKIAEAMGVTASGLERESRQLLVKGNWFAAGVANLAYTVWVWGDQAKQYLEKNVPVIGWLLGNFAQGLAHGVSMILNAFAGLFDLFGWIRDKIVSGVMSVWNAILGLSKIVMNAINSLIAPLRGLADAIRGVATGGTDVWGAIAGLGKEIADAVSRAVRGIGITVNVSGGGSATGSATLGAGILDLFGVP